MTEHRDNPSLPDRNRDIAGSLADHVRQFPAATPAETDVRDRLALIAEQGVPEASSVPETPAEPGEEVWETLPPNVNEVLTREGVRATYNGGLWTLDDGKRTQVNHGHFALHYGPFRPVPQR